MANFRIAGGYVEVTPEVNKVAIAKATNQIVDEIEKGSKRAGEKFSTGFGDETVRKSQPIGSRLAGGMAMGAKGFGKLFTANAAGAIETGLVAPIANGLKTFAKSPVGLAAIGITGAFIGSALASAASGALVAGVAVGVVGAGVALVAMREDVQIAFQGINHSIGESLKKAAQPFVASTLKGMTILRSGFNDILPDIEKSFASASRYVEPLSRAMSGFMKGVMPGVRAAVESAQPVINVLATALPRLGDAIGDAFKKIDGRQAAAGLEWVLKMTEGGIRGFGTLLQWAGDFFEFMIDMNLELVKFSEDIFGDLPVVGDKIRGTREDLEGLKATLNGTGEQATTTGDDMVAMGDLFSKSGDEVGGLKQELIDLDQKMRDITNAAISADEAQLALSEQYKTTAETIAANGRSTDISTEAYKNNRGSLIDLAKQINDTAASNLEAGQSADSASAAYDNNRRILINNAVQAGYTRKAAEDLANRWLDVPKNVNTYVTADTYTAKNKINELINIMANIRDKRVTVQIVESVMRQDAALANRVNNKASGGWINGPGSGTSDDVPINASDGEYVIRAAAAKKLSQVMGKDFLDKMNWYDRSGVGPASSMKPRHAEEVNSSMPSLRRPAGATSGSVINNYNITLDASKVKSMRDIEDLMNNLSSTSRQYVKK